MTATGQQSRRLRDPRIGNTGVGIQKAGGMHQRTADECLSRRSQRQGRDRGAVRTGKAPNGICFSPDYTKVYIIRAGGITRGRYHGGKVTNLRVFTDCMVDGVRCGPDGMRADKAGNIWASSAAPLGYCGVTVWNPRRQAAGPHPPAGRLRQSLFRRTQARPSVHDRDPVALHAAGEYPGCCPG